jgi:hypothetical protein
VAVCGVVCLTVVCVVVCLTVRRLDSNLERSSRSIHDLDDRVDPRSISKYKYTQHTSSPLLFLGFSDTLLISECDEILDGALAVYSALGDIFRRVSKMRWNERAFGDWGRSDFSFNIVWKVARRKNLGVFQ